MDMMTAVRTVFLKKYATFNGRARRAEYWWWTLAVFGVSILTQVIDISFLASDVAITSDENSFSAEHNGPLSTIFSLATLLPSIAVAVRRLHDVDKSGWWLLIILVPILGFLYLLYLTVQRGTVGTNNYGPDPIDPDLEPYEAPYPSAPDAGPEYNSPTQADDITDIDEADITPPRDRERPSWRAPSTQKGFQSTQDRFKDK